MRKAKAIEKANTLHGINQAIDYVVLKINSAGFIVRSIGGAMRYLRTHPGFVVYTTKKAQT